MIENINVMAKSDLTVSQRGKTYFTIEDDTGRKLITFNPRLHNELQVGSVVALDVKPPAKADGTPSFDIPKAEKPEEVAKPKAVSSPERSGQEVGMWWKELGNRIGDGSLERDFPQSHVRIKGIYYKQMESVTGINLKE